VRGAVVVFVLALVTTPAAFADAVLSPPSQLDAPGLTLAEAADRARSASFEVRAAIEAARMARADAASARAGLRPQLAISSTVLDANLSQLGMPVASQAYVGVAGSLPLLTPTLGATVRSVGLTADAAGSDIDAARNDAFFDAVRAYRRAQLAVAIVDARAAAVRDQQAHLDVTGARIRAGKAPRYLLARDRAALAVAQQAREDAAADGDEAINDLTVVLALDPSAPPHIATAIDVVAIDGSLDGFVARALVGSPLVLGAQLREKAAGSTVAAARAVYAPTATLSAQSYNGTSSPLLGHSGGQIALVASLPIVDGGTRSAAQEKAQATLFQARIALEKARASSERDVRNAWRELQAARIDLATARAGADDAAQQLRIARVREAAGKGIDLEVLDALSVAATAREAAVKAVARFDVAVASLHHATGDLTI
jgi:outer membrane protein